MNENTFCPECDGEVRFSIDPVVDQRTLCPLCGSELIVLRINPTVLDWAFIDPLSREDRIERLEVRSVQSLNEHQTNNTG